MANTIDSALIVKNLLAKSIPLQSPALPKVQSFCTVLELAPITGRIANVPNVTAVQSVQENPTSFENSGDTVAMAQVTPVHLSGQFGLLNADQASGLDMTLLLASHLTKLQLAIQGKIFAMLTAANFGNALTVSSAAYAEASMQTLLNAVAGRTCIALDTAWWSKTKRDWLPYGAESTLFECSDWTGAETNTHGFVARPEAIALCVGYPEVGPPKEVTTNKITLPIGLDVQLSTWFSRGSRSLRASLDIVVAPQVGKSGALRLLKSA